MSTQTIISLAGVVLSAMATLAIMSIAWGKVSSVVEQLLLRASKLEARQEKLEFRFERSQAEMSMIVNELRNATDQLKKTEEKMSGMLREIHSLSLALVRIDERQRQPVDRMKSTTDGEPY